MKSKQSKTKTRTKAGRTASLRSGTLVRPLSAQVLVIDARIRACPRCYKENYEDEDEAPEPPNGSGETRRGEKLKL